MKKTLLALFVFSLSTLCLATGRHFSLTTGVGIIQYSSGDQVYVYLETPVPVSIIDCSNGGAKIRWLLDTDTGKEFYAAALAAYAGGKRIELYFNAGAGCLNGFPQPTSFGLIN